MPDILSQGGSRGRGTWRPWAAAAAVLLLATVVIVQHLPRHRQSPAQPARAAGGVAPPPPAASGAAATAGGRAGEPGGITGRTLPWDARLGLPATGAQPAWFRPGAGRLKPIGGLPPQRSGYQFTRMAGGWAVQAGPGATAGCGSCAGPPRPVYFLADRAWSVTRVGMADAVAPGAAAGALWLTSYPPDADTRGAAGTAREVSIAGTPLGPPLTLPAGYLINRATDRGLLLAPTTPRPATTADELWDPAARQAGRMFEGVIAASAREIAWAGRCARHCRVHVLNLATARTAVVQLPAANSVANAAFSPDGRFLALQVSFSDSGDDGALDMQLEVMTVASGRLASVPRLWVSSDALVSFGWPARSDILVAALSFTAGAELASWHPGAGRLAVAGIRPGQSPASLITGQSPATPPDRAKTGSAVPPGRQQALRACAWWPAGSRHPESAARVMRIRASAEAPGHAVAGISRAGRAARSATARPAGPG